uniref:Uncharacterized protein n=1 Tax=Anopheles funestus TaxID=62324 RepID=A0A4Y0BUZ3_ANOFN
MVLKVFVLHRAFGVKLTFESIEQTLRQDLLWFDLRVREYNRTKPKSSVLHGTIHMQQEGTNDYKFYLDHVSIKLTTAGMCDFFDNLYENYGEYMDILANAPERVEYPKKKKIGDMYIFDTEFPTEVVSQTVLRNGLWKALKRCYL